MATLRYLFWALVSKIVCIPWVATWLIRQAQTTPYTHIYGRDRTLYMGRWWLFNPYPTEAKTKAGMKRPRWRELAPSVRVHWIRRPDMDRHRHGHPWDARTIILRNGYREERALSVGLGALTNEFWRGRGYTGEIAFNEYHRITEVHPDGAWTLFITWKKQGSWGFDVDGVQVPWREYTGANGVGMA